MVAGIMFFFLNFEWLERINQIVSFLQSCYYFDHLYHALAAKMIHQTSYLFSVHY